MVWLLWLEGAESPFFSEGELTWANGPWPPSPIVYRRSLVGTRHIGESSLPSAATTRGGRGHGGIRTKVRIRIVLLLATLSVGFALTLVGFWGLERQRASLLVRGIEQKEAKTFGELLDLRGASLHAFVSDYTFWDDMVRFVEAPDRSWAAENIDTALDTFDADSAWVYRTDGTLAYGASSSKSIPDRLPWGLAVFREVFVGQAFAHFFLDTPGGPLEVWGATIHPTTDPDRQTPPRGYFFAGRLWDQNFLAELSSLAGGTVELFLPGQDARPSIRENPAAIAFSQGLLDWRGHPVRHLHVQAVSPILEQVNRLSRVTFLLLFIFAVIVLVVPSVLLVRWVNVPLRQITRSLELEDPTALDRLQQSRTEFGDLSRLVGKFLEQEGLLREAKTDAERANLAKSEFLSRMSHELRTPLNAVLGFAQLLEMDNLKADQRDSVAHILKGGRHLLDLINEVLDIARIEAGRLTITVEPILLSDVIEEAFAMVQPLGETAGLQLTYERPAGPASRVQADRQRLMQVLLNLLSNAIKYNRAGGSVAVRLDRGKNGAARVVIEDTGAGIAPEQMARLFTPFERLGAEDGKVEGSGLGLALSKRLVEAMGGALGVDSVVGKGSAFWVELPTEPATAGSPFSVRRA